MKNKYFRWGFAALCFVAAALLFMLFFQQINIAGSTLAIDWNGIWNAIKDGNVLYAVGQGFRIPPWDAALVTPLGFIPMRASWGLITFITTVVLVVSVPKAPHKWLYWLAVILLTISFPALRLAADGNFEALIIGGTLLIVYAYRKQQPYLLAAGTLLAVAKPQETVLLMLVLAIYVLQTFPRPTLLKLIGVLAVIVVPFMLWKGGDWLHVMLGIPQRASEADMSLLSAYGRAGGLFSPLALVAWIAVLLVTLYVAWVSQRTLSREKAAMLICASLLVAPYASGNSALTPIAIGVIPLLIDQPLLGIGLFVLIDAPILFHNASVVEWVSYYWTGWLLLMWGIFGWRVWRVERRSVPIEEPRAAVLAVEKSQQNEL
jgi:hypothetical protein